MFTFDSSLILFLLSLPIDYGLLLLNDYYTTVFSPFYIFKVVALYLAAGEAL